MCRPTASSKPGTSRRSQASRAMFARKPSTMSFSFSPPDPLVPLSMPPWPGSSTIKRPRDLHPFSAAARLGFDATQCGWNGSPARWCARSWRDPWRRDRGPAGPVGLPLRSSTKAFLDAYRPLGVDHDAGSALHDQPVAERLDQTAALLGGLGRKLEGDLWQVDHDAVGIGERKCGKVDLAIEIDDKTRLLVVSADAQIGRNDRGFVRSGQGPNRATALGGHAGRAASRRTTRVRQWRSRGLSQIRTPFRLF